MVRPTGADPTLVLNELAQTLDDLPPTEQRQALALLARPTDGTDSSDLFSYPATVTVKQDCLTHVCVHYAASGVHAPPPGDANADGVNDWAHLNAVVMEKVWTDESHARLPPPGRRPRREPGRGPGHPARRLPRRHRR